ncbi:MAG: oligosaccharide flippase family protein [Pseudomonadota bacterium]
MSWFRTRMANRQSLTARSVESLAWSVGSRSGMIVLKLGANLITTSVLLPEAFGLIATVFLIHGILQMLSDMGIGGAVIRSQHGDQEAYLQTAWTVHLIRHCVLAVLVLAAGGGLWWLQGQTDLGELTWGHPDMPGMIAFSAFLLLVMGCYSANEFLAHRRVQIYMVDRNMLISQVVGSTAMVILVLSKPTPWSLLIGSSFAPITQMMLSHRLPGPRMRLRLVPEYRQEIWDFGKWLIVSSSFGLISNHGDRLILSVLVDARTIGIYAIARLWYEGFDRLFAITSYLVNSVISETKRLRPERLQSLIDRLMLLVLCVAGMATAGLWLFAEVLIETIYEPVYHSAGPMLALFSMVFLSRRIFVLNGVLKTFGDTRSIAVPAMTSSLILVTVSLSLYPLIGLKGIIAGVVFANVLPMWLMLWATGRHVHVDWRREAAIEGTILAIAVAAIVMSPL